MHNCRDITEEEESKFSDLSVMFIRRYVGVVLVSEPKQCLVLAKPECAEFAKVSVLMPCCYL